MTARLERRRRVFAAGNRNFDGAKMVVELCSGLRHAWKPMLRDTMALRCIDLGWDRVTVSEYRLTGQVCGGKAAHGAPKSKK